MPKTTFSLSITYNECFYKKLTFKIIFFRDIIVFAGDFTAFFRNLLERRLSHFVIRCRIGVRRFWHLIFQTFSVFLPLFGETFGNPFLILCITRSYNGYCLKDSFPLRGLRHEFFETWSEFFFQGLKDSFPLRGLRPDNSPERDQFITGLKDSFPLRGLRQEV